MPLFLSPDWIRDLDKAARESARLKSAEVRQTLVVEQRVTGTPSGDVTYHLVLGAAARVDNGPAETPDVILVTDYQTAVELHTGSLNAQHAIATGRMSVHGQVGVLLRHAETLRALGDVFRDVRATTEAPGASDGRR